MESTESVRQQIWREAIASAIGPLAAYLAPQSFDVSVIKLTGMQDNDRDFSVEIARRIDLGRASIVARIIEEATLELPHIYRHVVHYSEDRIDGVLVVPRLVRERAAGRENRIPVLRAVRFTETPEALLVSELLRLSARIANAWITTSGSEGVFARQLALKIGSIESQQPWATLRARSRADVRSLAASVKTRAVSGWTPVGGAFEQLADLVLISPNSVLPDLGPIAFPLSEDERYADRVFELICIGWLLSGLKELDPAGHVNPKALRKSNIPLYEGTRKGVRVRLFYQAGYLSKISRYKWRLSGKNLRAIPDYSLEFDRSGWSRTVLLDAKNRTFTSSSEIIYKLLGYQENLGISPYSAIAIAPAFLGRTLVDGVEYDSRKAIVVCAPLTKGKRLFRRLLPKLVDSFISDN